jgi:hypothetical protein
MSRTAGSSPPPKRPQQRSFEEVLLVEDGVRPGASDAALAVTADVAVDGPRVVAPDGPLVRLHGEQLLRVVPLVEGVLGGEPLVALQPDQLRAEPAGQHLRERRLAGAGRPLDEQRFHQPERQQHRRDDVLVRDVVMVVEGPLDVLRGDVRERRRRTMVAHGTRIRVSLMGRREVKL